MVVITIPGMLPELFIVLLGYGAGKKSDVCMHINAAMPFTKLFGQCCRAAASACEVAVRWCILVHGCTVLTSWTSGVAKRSYDLDMIGATFYVTEF